MTDNSASSPRTIVHLPSDGGPVFVEPMKEGDSGYAVARSEGLDVLRDFAILAQPLAPHIAEIRRLLAEAEPFDDPDEVPEAKRRPITVEMCRLLETAGPEGQCYAVAAVVAEAGERAAAHETLLRLAWPAIERSTFPPLPESFKAELSE